MKTNLKKEYEKQQKKQKAKNIIKWVACGLGWTALLGAFVGMVALGCKSCANKKVDSQNTTRVIGDYTLNKRQIEDLPYKYYYRYTDRFPGYDHWAQSEQITAEFDMRLKYISNEVVGDNGYYRELHYFLLNIDTSSNNELFIDLYGSETNGHIDSSDNLLYSTYHIGEDFDHPDNYIQIGFIDSSLDLMNYQGDNACISFIHNIIKSNAVVNLNLSFDFNDQINRYGVIGSANSIFAQYNQSYQGSKLVIQGYFKDSLDNYYKGIKITYLNGISMKYLDSEGRPLTQEADCLMYLSLQYVKTDNTEVSVNYARYSSIDSNVCYTGDSYWIADSFRHLTIFYLDTNSSQLPVNNYQPLEIMQMFNNNTIGSDLGGLGGSTGVFGLLTQGFASVANILNMQIIPGITLGLFIFIPFSIMILLACVWLFKR